MLSIDDAASTCCHLAASEPFSLKQRLDWSVAWRGASTSRDTAPPLTEITANDAPGSGEIATITVGVRAVD